MHTTLDLLFLIALSFLIIGHELDAIYKREWRFFFAQAAISDQRAYRIFTALHVPLVVVILWHVQSFWFQVSFDLFTVAHASVHWLLRKHPLIAFQDWFSMLWIYGAAVLGGVHFIYIIIA